MKGPMTEEHKARLRAAAHTKTPSLCWECHNSVCRPGNPCQWAMNGPPVQGWSAETTQVQSTTTHRHKFVPKALPSYRVESCPHYRPEQRKRRVEYNSNALVALAAAVVRQAVDDYMELRARREGYKREPLGFNVYDPDPDELDRFFHSAWADTLCLGNAEYILKRLRKEVLT